jgi:hypothetical protein
VEVGVGHETAEAEDLAGAVLGGGEAVALLRREGLVSIPGEGRRRR